MQADNALDADIKKVMHTPILDFTLSFPDETLIRAAIQEYAQFNNSKVIVRSSGRLVCERWGSPDAPVRPRANGVDCKYQITYGCRKDGRWHFRKDSTCLNHNHDVTEKAAREPGTHIDSEIDITDEMKEIVRKLIKLDVPRCKIESHLLKEFQIASINSVTFRSVIEDARRHVGYRSDGHEVKTLVDWIQTPQNKSAHYHIGTDADLRCNKLFFMNQTMMLDFKYTGQVLIMDCTCKTNRFGWALFVCVGVNQHLKTALLSIALQKSEDIETYDWVLDCMKDAVGEQMWKNVRMVMTDGDAALINSVTTRIPHARQHRCRWHIGQNIRTNCRGELGKNYKQFNIKYQACVQAATVFAFNSNWEALINFVQPYPITARYLTDNIYPTREQWASAWTNTCCSLGACNRRSLVLDLV